MFTVGNGIEERDPHGSKQQPTIHLIHTFHVPFCCTSQNPAAFENPNIRPFHLGGVELVYVALANSRHIHPPNHILSA